MVSVPTESTVLHESAAQRDGLFGGLVVIFAIAFVRGVTGASTTAGRVAVIVIFGVVVIGIFVGWMRRRRRANWLEVSAERISLKGPKSVEPCQLVRTDGARLQFIAVGPVRARSVALTIHGGNVVIPLQFFKKKRVRELCVAYGWQFH